MAPRNARRISRSPVVPNAPASVSVWTLPIRVTHWLLALTTTTAWFTANVFDTVHEIAGYSVLALIAFRIWLGLSGEHFGRFKYFPLQHRLIVKYLVTVARGRPRRYLGHNPAGAAMSIVLLILLAVAGVSGWMQITNRFFGVAWVQDVHTYASHIVFALALVHALAVLAMCRVLKENLVRGMITGQKRAPGAARLPE